MAKAKPAGAVAALSEQIERRQQASLVAAARRKLEAQQELTQREVAALKKFEREQRDRYGTQYLSAMPKGDYAGLSGRQSKQLIEAADRYGFPYRPEEKTVDVGRVLRWFHDFLAANAGMLSGGGGGDDAILHLASKELKDEYVRKRIEEKAVDIERKRLEVAQLDESYGPIEPLRQYHRGMAGLLRGIRLKLTKRFEGVDQEFVEQAFDDLITDCERLGDSHFNDEAIDIDVSEPAAGGPLEADLPS